MIYHTLIAPFIGKCVEVMLRDTKYTARGILDHLEEDAPMTNVIAVLLPEPALGSKNGGWHIPISHILAIREVEPYNMPCEVRP